MFLPLEGHFQKKFTYTRGLEPCTFRLKNSTLSNCAMRPYFTCSLFFCYKLQMCHLGTRPMGLGWKTPCYGIRSTHPGELSRMA